MPTLSMMARITLRRNNMEGRGRRSTKRALLTRIYVNSGKNGIAPYVRMAILLKTLLYSYTVQFQLSTMAN